MNEIPRRYTCKQLLALGLFVVASSLAGCSTTASAESGAQSADVNYEGLATVKSRRLDLAQLNPNVDFSIYTGVIIRVPQLAFERPDRSARQFAVTEEQTERLRNMLSSSFEAEFEKLKNLSVVTEPADDVLSLSIRVEGITTTASPSAIATVGRAAAILEASADATLVLELRDSRSNALLARGVDAASASGAAIRSGERGMKTRFEDVETVCRKWASASRKGLDALTSGN